MLTPKKRFSKKDLKEDKLVTYYFQVQDWFEANAKLVYGVLAVIIVLVGAYIYYDNSLEKAEQLASVDLSKAMRVYEASDYSNAITLFSNLVEEYGSTTSGKLGKFYLANSFYKIGDYTNAKEYFKKSVSGLKSDDHLAAAAAAGVAACMEQEENFAEAAKTFENVAKKYSKTPLASHYVFKAARCYTLAENKDKAASLYDQIISDYSDDEQIVQDAELFKSML